MKLPVRYAEAKRLYPDAVLELEARISKSANKMTAPSAWNWSYNWGVRVNAIPFDKLAAELGKPVEHKTVEQKMQELDCIVTLVASCKRSHLFSKELLKPVPGVILDFHRRAFEQAEQERLAFEALPAAEKRQRTEETLRELGFGNSGIAMILGDLFV